MTWNAHEYCLPETATMLRICFTSPAGEGKRRKELAPRLGLGVGRNSAVIPIESRLVALNYFNTYKWRVAPLLR